MEFQTLTVALYLGIVSIVIGVATLAGPPIAKKLGLVKAIVVTQLASTIFMFATPFVWQLHHSNFSLLCSRFSHEHGKSTISVTDYGVGR